MPSTRRPKTTPGANTNQPTKIRKTQNKFPETAGGGWERASRPRTTARAATAIGTEGNTGNWQAAERPPHAQLD